MNAFDIIVLAVIGLSALFAFARGFVKEVLSILAWIGAALIALHGIPYARHYAAGMISSPVLADIATGGALFIVSLIVLSFVASMVARGVKHSPLSAVDRALGLLFGIVRGVLLVCAGFLAFHWGLQGSEMPNLIQEARTRPALEQGAKILQSFIPAELRERGINAANQVQQTAEQAREADKLMRALSTPTPASASTGKPASPTPASGYTPAQRKELDQRIQQLQ